MTSWLKQYWAELLVFGVIFGVLLMCTAPDMTWINTDSDGIHYTYAAKYLYPAHKTSAPLFLLLGHVFLWLPIGTEFWRMSLISVLSSTASAVFIYLIIRKKLLLKNAGNIAYSPSYIEKVNKKNRIYALIGALIFGGSALVISQSTIVETYALVTMFGLGAYYFATKGNWLYCALMLGAGGAVHHLILIPLLILLIFYKGLRQWKYIGVMSAFLLFYLYIPITLAAHPPNLFANMWGNTTLTSFIKDNSSTVLMLIGGLSIWGLPKRVFDAIGVVGVSLGLAIIPMAYYIKIRHTAPNPIRKQWYKEPLLWLLTLPIIYYATNLAPQTYVYMMPAIGFGAVIAGIGLSRMRHYWKWTVLGCAVGLLVFNANYFDIGRTLDPNLSAKEYYNQELHKVPDGAILVAQQGWEWACIPKFNKEENRNIIPVCTGTLPSKYYQDWLKAQGVKMDIPEVVRYEFSSDIAASILKMNDNVWLTTPTDPKTYGAEIVPAKGNKNLLGNTSHAVLSTNEWKWKPSNPYDIITGAIEVKEWVAIVVSNYNIQTFAMLGMIGLVPVWIGHMLFIRKKKWNWRKIINGQNKVQQKGM